MIARRIIVHGRVQGVGFRFFVVGVAEDLGVAGWVRNRRDGTVEALLQGEEDAVERAIAWARRGPPAARVERVDIAEVPNDATITGFGGQPTV